jgi:hypothetical protein
MAQLATGLVAVVQGGYLLAQTSRDVMPMASAIDMAIAHLHRLAREQDEASWRGTRGKYVFPHAVVPPRITAGARARGADGPIDR